MKLTKNQERELVLVKYFCPVKEPLFTEEGIKMFFENSENGLHKKLVGDITRKPFDKVEDKYKSFYCLMLGKIRREINIAMYIQDFKDFRDIQIKIWVEGQEFPNEVAEAIIEKLK